jgi:hypothetical protein
MRKPPVHVFTCAGQYAVLKATVRIDKRCRSFGCNVLSGWNAAFRAPISGVPLSYKMFFQLWLYCRTIVSYGGEQLNGSGGKPMLFMGVH